jgi:acetoin utilization deacetylase AcuC-like enzyme
MAHPRPVLLRDRRYRDHAGPSGHPERPERLDAIDRALAPYGDRVASLEPRSAEREELLGAHRADYVDVIEGLAGQATRLDADTYLAPRSVQTARLAAGGCVELARRVARAEAPSGFALVRPPGHHAEPARGMGFCLFNNVAVTARALQSEERLERIAIVDWDVHHGNGTQARFEPERDVLFVSLHQFPLYPGTGAAREMGSGAGEGHTVNLPLPAGCGDAEYLAAFERIVVPVLQEFRPEILLVSAGFDAHEADPLAGMRVTTPGFVAMAARLRAAAEDLCGGRLALLLEGGYDLDALGASVAGVVEVLCADEAPAEDFGAPAPEIAELLDALRDAQSSHWQRLRPIIAG